MKTYEFVCLVERMRSEQKAYFLNHSRQALCRAKVLERKVDLAIEEINQTIPQQGTLLEV